MHTISKDNKALQQIMLEHDIDYLNVHLPSFLEGHYADIEFNGKYDLRFVSKDDAGPYIVVNNAVFHKNDFDMLDEVCMKHILD